MRFTGTCIVSALIATLAVFGYQPEPQGGLFHQSVGMSQQAANASVPSQGLPVVEDRGQIRHVNWFSDWQICIWGIGAPTAWIIRNPIKAQQYAWKMIYGRNPTGGAAAVYGAYVYNACVRFMND